MEAGEHLSHRDKRYHSRGSVGCLWQIIPRVCHEDMERRRILARDASGEAAGKLREAEDPDLALLAGFQRIGPGSPYCPIKPTSRP